MTDLRVGMELPTLVLSGTFTASPPELAPAEEPPTAAAEEAPVTPWKRT